MRSFLFAFTDGDVWRPGIGDPTIMGWVTVIAYFAAAVPCIRCARDSRYPSQKGRELVFWSALALMLFVLGINKQLDLQTWLTLSARRMAVAQGWYDHRRIVQLCFVLFVGLASAGAFILMWQLVRARSQELWLSLLGFVLLLGFVIIRAASFHHVDTLINSHFAGMRMNWILEIGAMALIAIGALRKVRTRNSNAERLDSSAKVALP